ncbi:ABC transporter permease subunit [Micromonospora sp. NPDC050200]|uniref:ABC transporter permease subunit n=1 Tax=Micromonospora sp. NPDC050200 TaxID=3155664 RepID=UPI00340291BC
MPDIMTRTLWEGRRALTGFTVGTALVGALYAGFYPQVADGAMGQAAQGFSPALRAALRMEDLTSAAGYLGSSVFGIIVPLIAVGWGIATGARAIAGDEEAGHLDLLLAHPVSRTKVVLHRFAALTAGAALIAGAVWVAMLAVRPGANLDDIGVDGFAAQCLALALLVVVFGTLALAIGAATGSRGAALGGSAATVVLTYAAQALAGQIGAGALRHLSPFHHYIGAEPLRHGFQWADLATLAGTALVLLVVAVTTFDRRDLAT